MTTPVLELRAIDRTYKTSAGDLQVLRGTDLRIAPGELVGLVGPSGSGKSTLLHTAGLLEQPEAGDVLLDGADCLKLNENGRTAIRRKKIGFVYQFHHLLPEFNAVDNVAMPLMIAGTAEEGSARQGVVASGGNGPRRAPAPPAGPVVRRGTAARRDCPRAGERPTPRDCR